MFLYILNHALALGEGFLVANFLVSSLGTKKKNFRYIAIGILSFILYLIVYNLYDVIPDESVVALIEILVCILFEIIFLDGKPYKKILLPIISTVITLIINIVVLTIFSISFQFQITEFEQENSIVILLIAFSSKMLYFFVTYFLISILNKTIYHLTAKEWIAVIAIYLATLFVGISIFEVCVKADDVNNTYLLLPIIGLTFINLLSFFFIREISKEKKDKLKFSLLAMQLEHQKKEVSSIQQQFEEMMKVKHDLKNYLLACQSLLTEKKYEEAMNFISKLTSEKLNSYTSLILTGNSIVDAILSSKLFLCQHNKIKVSYAIHADTTSIDDMDFSILLANLFDNAIEACNRNECESEINISLTPYQSYVHLVIQNTIDSSVLSTNPKLRTSKKKDAYNHGYGLKTVDSIVNKYNGMKNIYEQNNNFIVDILLCTQCAN